MQESMSCKGWQHQQKLLPIVRHNHYQENANGTNIPHTQYLCPSCLSVCVHGPQELLVFWVEDILIKACK